MKCGTFMDLPELPKRALDAKFVVLGKRLRDLRQSCDVSLGELARQIGTSPAKLSDLELGRENDPRFKWCPKCSQDTWRKCENCCGKGYVEK